MLRMGSPDGKDISRKLFFSKAANRTKAVDIFASTNIADIVKHKDRRTLYVIDLDETLWESAHEIMRRRWYTAYINSLEQTGILRVDAVAMAVAIFNAAQRYTTQTPVERHTLHVMDDIKADSFGTLGLTARSPAIRGVTESHLKAINVSFTCGVIYTDGSANKPPCLLEYFESLDVLPELVVVVDDVRENVVDMRTVVNSLGMDFVGYHYHHVESRPDPFDFRIGERQRELFDLGRGTLHTDAEIRQMLSIVTGNGPKAQLSTW